MENKKRYSLVEILLTSVWILIGAGAVVLLMAAVQKKDAAICKGILVNIEGVSNNYFVDKTDILNSIAAITKGEPVGKSIGSFNLKLMEASLEKSTWIKGAELFFDNNDQLQVNVLEREPIARVFSSSGRTFYIDEELTILPLSEKFSARLPVFTNYPSTELVSAATQQHLLESVKMISLTIQKDSFRMAMIEQVDIMANGSFEMIPKIGNQLILLGNGNDLEEKFKKLEIFYREVMVKAGWNKYSVIDLQFKNQVVAKRRGAEDIAADSIRTLQLMQQIAANAEKLSNDSLRLLMPDNDRVHSDSSMIQQSIQRDENNNESSYTIEKPQPQGRDSITPAPIVKPMTTLKKPVVIEKKPALVKKQSPAIKIQKPVTKPTLPKPALKQPKILMPKKNDYR